MFNSYVSLLRWVHLIKNTPSASMRQVPQLLSGVGGVTLSKDREGQIERIIANLGI